MPRQCVVGGCKNTNRDGFKLHQWPKDAKVARNWTKFVQNTRVWVKATKWSLVCSAHFTDDSYATTEMARMCGYPATLKADAFPTIKSKKSAILENGPPLNLPECVSYSGTMDLGSTASDDGSLFPQMSEPKISLSQFLPYIRCALCFGFLIDATTVTECLHTFCKSCIVKHFFSTNKCPTCEIVVHQTQPLYNIRFDRQLQDLVYKMVPFLEASEKGQMCNFYKKRGMDIPKSVIFSCAAPSGLKRQKKDRVTQSVFNIPPELDVSLLLEFVGAEEGITSYKPLERRYVRVSGGATIRHVELFIRRKMELDPTCQVDMVCGDHLLDPYQALNDVQRSVGAEALQDGLLVLHFGLVLPNQC
ncbi:polycomb group RING finger protein 6 isoform X3 [Nerophis ophidion]|uniref:polycomb group RING finger protein 6 isoform X3 n=1 Tax=Nerophis ophidion TaxID=159077 RepID=UPI002AE01D32|nr:polycomb group RING finger protein 6 isoform X3 [Nerophis ophidion]